MSRCKEKWESQYPNQIFFPHVVISSFLPTRSQLFLLCTSIVGTCPTQSRAFSPRFTPHYHFLKNSCALAPLVSALLDTSPVLYPYTGTCFHFGSNSERLPNSEPHPRVHVHISYIGPMDFVFYSRLGTYSPLFSAP